MGKNEKKAAKTSGVFFTPEQAAGRWSGAITTATLANWRASGTGPAYVKLGSRVVYPLEELLAFEKKGLKVE
jgi:hypothetical protein